jgi:CDP-diacylglycerol---serine O-phosphatidyltransferase
MNPPGSRFGAKALPQRLRRGAYLLPSLFTIGNILLGFYAVIVGLRSVGLAPWPGDTEPTPRFAFAAMLVVAASFLDSLDGRLARMTGTESEFGKQYDSLADVLTFGVTPALLTYLWGVRDLATQAWLVPLFYLVCVATRLARFNVQSRVIDSRFFVGLPAPAAAAAVCSLLFFAPNTVPRFLEGTEHAAPWRTVMLWLVVAALLVIGTLMVSTFRYHSFKKIDLRKRWSYRAFIVLAAIVLVVIYLPEAVFPVIAIVYAASGPVAYLWSKLRSRRPHPEEPPIPESPLP